MNYPFEFSLSPPQVFVELNELIMDKNQEMQWRETARWIKFEEDVEEETDRWGKPHVASLSFRSLLELRKTISHGRRGGEGEKERTGRKRVCVCTSVCALTAVTVVCRVSSATQGRCCWTWTRRPCLASPTRW